MSGWTQPMKLIDGAINRAMKRFGNNIVRNAKLKTTYDYIGIISGQTRNSIISGVSGDELTVAVGTWWGAAFNVQGGFSRFRHGYDPAYARMAYGKRGRRGREAAWSGRGAYRPFLMDAIREEANGFRQILIEEGQRL